MKHTLWKQVNVPASTNDFGIELNIGFARRMLNKKINDKFSNKLNEMARSILATKNCDYHKPLDFFQNTKFVNEFYLGKKGIWLSTGTSDPRMQTNEKVMRYFSHNVGSKEDAQLLTRLVDLWTTYSH